MKTFEQFLTEAGAGQGRKVGTKYAQGPANIPQGRSTRQTRKDEVERTKRLENLPAGTGTSGSESRRNVEIQLAAQKAEKDAQQAAEKAAERAKQESQAKLAGAAEALAAQKQDPAYIEQQNKLAKARERSAKRAAKKANP